MLVDAEALDDVLLLLVVVADEPESEPEDADTTVVVEHVPVVALESLSSTYIITIIMSLSLLRLDRKRATHLDSLLR